MRSWKPHFLKLKSTVVKHKVLVILLLFLLTVVTAVTVPLIGKYQLTYDEGWNLQAPTRVSETGTYASFGNLFNGEDKVFDQYLSTGPAVSMPIAVSFSLFGVGVAQERVVMLLFFLATIILAIAYIYINTKSVFSILGGVWITFITSPIIIFNFSMLGEIPAIGFAIASFLAYQKKKYIFAGILVSLAILSKTIMLFVLLAFIAAIVIEYFFGKSFKKSLKIMALWSTGVLIPAAIWQTYKLIQLGSPGAFKQSWIDFYDFFRGSGSGIAESGASAAVPILTKFTLILDSLDLNKILAVIAFASLFAVIVAGVVVLKKRSIVIARKYLPAITFTVGYLVWWIFISNGVFARYTVPLVAIGFIVMLALSLELRVPKARKYILLIQNSLLSVVAIVCLVGFVERVYGLANTSSEPTLASQQEVAMIASRYANEGLYHVGWWQNSEIAFLANIHTKNVTNVEKGVEYVLLLSPTMKDVEPLLYDNFRDTCKEVIYSNGDYVLCRAIRDDLMTY